MSLLPPSSSLSERALEGAVERAFTTPDADVIARMWNPDTCPAAFLPWLAWALSVDTWDAGWTEETQRAVIRASIAVHRRKGTRAAVRTALDAAGYGDAELIEDFGWDYYNGASLHDGSIDHQPGDHWAEYRVILARPMTVAQSLVVRAILDAVQPARCHLKVLDFTATDHLYNAALLHDGVFNHGAA
jgi:phage tail P2-like protein